MYLYLYERIWVYECTYENEHKYLQKCTFLQVCMCAYNFTIQYLPEVMETAHVAPVFWVRVRARNTRKFERVHTHTRTKNLQQCDDVIHVTDLCCIHLQGRWQKESVAQRRMYWSAPCVRDIRRTMCVCARALSVTFSLTAVLQAARIFDHTSVASSRENSSAIWSNFYPLPPFWKNCSYYELILWYI